MGRYQTFRGSPIDKLYYVVENFSGGVNTKDVDDNMADFEFREMTNINLEKQGIIQNRRGFGEIETLTTMLSDANITLEDDMISLTRVIKNDNAILEKIVDGEELSYGWVESDEDFWDEYGEVAGDLDVHVLALNTDTWEENFGDALDYGLAARISSQEDDYYGDYYTEQIAETTEDVSANDYLGLAYYSDGVFGLYPDLYIYNIDDVLKIDFGMLRRVSSTEYAAITLDKYDVAVTDVSDYNEIKTEIYNLNATLHDNIFVNKTEIGIGVKVTDIGGDVYYVTELPFYFEVTADLLYTYHYYRSVFSFTDDFKILMINKNKINLLKYEDGILTYTNIHSLTKILSGEYNTKLTGVNVVSHISKLYVSLNELSPNYRGILVYDRDDDSVSLWRGESFNGVTWSTMTSENVYKPKPYDISGAVASGFNVLANDPLLYIDDQKIGFPSLRAVILTDTSGNYLENIPTTGSFVVNIVKTGSLLPENFKLEFKDEDGDMLFYIVGDQATGVYGVDNGGYFSYTVSNLYRTDIDYVIMNVLYQDFVINKPNKTLNAIELFSFNSQNYYYAVEDEGFVYKCVKDETTGGGGTRLTDFEKIKVDFFITVASISAQEPEDVGIFDIFMVSDNDGAIFQLRSATGHRTFSYVHSTTSFTELQTDEVLYENYKHFIPYPGTLINNSSSDYYYFPNVYSRLTLDVAKTDINLNLAVPGIEGQYYDISDEDTEQIVGLDLEGVKLEVINNKLVYYKGNTIYFSSLYQFDYVPNFSFVILPLLSTDEIQTIKYFKGAWMIFTKEQIFKMKGTYGESDWEIKELNRHIGCISPDSVRSIENTLYFLSSNGLYRITQNYYLEGLENVQKSDKNIPGLFPISTDVQSFLYRDQYILYTPSNDEFDAIRMYHNIDLQDKQHPFVTDIFTVKPVNLFKSDWNILSIKDNKFYAYDLGNTDFLPDSLTDVENYIYTCSFLTSNINFGYPMHDKKIKSLYVKTYSEDVSFLHFTIWIDDFLKISPYNYSVTIDENEEIVYAPYLNYEKDNNIDLTPSYLSNFEISNDFLGDGKIRTHKIVVGYKGKTISIKVEQKSNGDFGISKMGYLYKLGKVREQR